MNKTAKAYELLLEHLGPQEWWPADSPFEIIIGALLMQQTSWRNVETAISNLKRSDMMRPERLAASRLDDIKAMVRPAGLHRTKPARIRDFARQIMKTSGGSVEEFLRRDAGELRRELLSLDGIGPETADSILLYAAGAPVFVVDAYTLRFSSRIGLVDSEDYDVVQGHFERSLPRDTGIYQEYHALIVELAKRFCRRVPRCGECPLAVVCDHARAAPKAREK